MERVLGLDLGTNSVGWALVERDDDATATPFLKAGVYVFPEAGELDGGLFVSNRLKRGQKRRQRIQVRRKRQRMQRVTALLVAHGLLPADPAQRNALLSADWDPETGTRSHHPFFLRRRGLDEALTLHEFGRCLHHIARRRGYFSTRDLMRRGLEDRLGLARATEADLRPDDTEGAVAVEDAKASKETSQLLGRLREVREQILAGTARTIGEFCAQKLEDTQNARGVRASGGRKAPRSPKPDPLGWRADRLLHEEEFARLWEAQAAHHPRALTSALRRALWDAIFHQRPLMSKRGLVGRCEFLPARKRMPRAALLAQRCSILQRLVNLRVRETRASAPRPLTGAEVSALADALEVKDQLGWRDVRATAGLPNSALFADEAPEDGAQKRPRGKAKRTTPALRGNQTAKAMRSALGDAWDALAPERQNELVERRLHCRYVQDIVRGLRRDFRFTDEQIEAVAHAALPDGYTMHCARVWRDLEPRLRAGMSYWQACVDAGFRREGESTVAPPEKVLQRLGGLPDLRSPVVQRAAKMAFRVINAVIDKYGKPDRIRIEMPRDVSKTNKQREEEWRRQDQNNRAREKARKRLEQHGLLGDDKSAETRIKKVRLWEEADCRSPYEPDVQVTLSQLIHEYEIDHIVPRSRCWDDSWMNLTICSHSINLQKGNQTPHEWANAMQWARIREHVLGLSDKRMPSAKKERILREEWTQEEFTNRALSDTRYLSTVIKREVAKLGVPVEVSRGQLTAELRSLWKLGGCLPASPVEREHVEKWRRSGARRGPKPRFDHRHHALDAVLAALTDASTLQRMTRWYHEREKGVPSNRIPKPKPWPTLTKDLADLMEGVGVVFAPTRSVHGALHKETGLRPPEQSEIDAALAALPAARRRPRPHTVVVGPQLVLLDERGRGRAAYNLRSNHHAVIWEAEDPGPDGTRRRDVTVTPMIEAARRAQAREPVIRRERPGWRYLMAICKDDVVELTGDDAGLWRVAKFSIEAAGGLDIALRPLWLATADLASTVLVKGRKSLVRVRSRDKLLDIACRVSLSPLGEAIATEPPGGRP